MSNQIFVENGMRENNFRRTTQYYDLLMKLKDGKGARLLSGISTFEDAKRLERMIEEILHICDGDVDRECVESQSERAIDNIDALGPMGPPT